jgi:dolichyl-phosphate-mannose--protein O-mannosyl transferase
MEFSNGLSQPALRSAKLNRTIAILAALIMLVRILHAMFIFNSTVDEPYHIASAVAMYDTGKVTSGVEQPPVTRLVSGLPLYLLGVHFPHSELSTAIVSLPDTFDQGTEILFHNKVSYWKVLRTARLSMLVFPLAALLYLYLLAAWIGNEFIAALSVVFFSLDPAFLGNSAWVHNDSAACTAYLAATYYGARWVVLGGMRRAVIMGIAVGLAIATKFSCVVVVPAIVLLMIVLPGTCASGPRSHTSRRLRSSHSLPFGVRIFSTWTG